jgi:WD40 repeat protein
MDCFTVLEKKPVILKQYEIDSLIESHVNSVYQHHPQQSLSNELTFLRDLITNGQWLYVEEFLTPFKKEEGHVKILYHIYQQEYMELMISTRDDKRKHRLKEVLDRLSILCPSKEEYSYLCLLLNNANISSHPLYSNWSLYNSRESLYKEIHDFVQHHLYPSCSVPPSLSSQDSRLVQLIARGLMYERCEEIHMIKHGLKPIPSGHILDLVNWLQHLQDSCYQMSPDLLPVNITCQPENESCIGVTPPCHGVSHSSSVPDKTLNHESQKIQKPPGFHLTPSPHSSGMINTTPFTTTLVEDSPKHEDKEETELIPQLVRWPNVRLISKFTDKQVIRSVSFSKSGSLAAVGANSRTLRVIDCSNLSSPDGKGPFELYHCKNYHKGSVYTLDWLNDTLVASASNDQAVKLLKCQQEQFNMCGEIKDLGGTIRELSFDASCGRSIILCCSSGSHPLQVIDLEHMVVSNDIKDFDNSLLCLAVISEHVVVTGGENGSVALWDLRSSSKPTVVHSLPHSITSISHYNGLLSYSTTDGGCYTTELSSHEILKEWKPHTDQCRSIRYSPDGQWLLSGCYNGQVSLTHSASYQWTVLASHSDKVIQTRWHPSEPVIATTSADKTACFWKLQL